MQQPGQFGRQAVLLLLLCIGQSIAELYCTEDITKQQVQLFKANNAIQSSACQRIGWYDWLTAVFQSGHLTVMDIGCNKGYESMEYLHGAIPNFGKNASVLGALHAANPGGALKLPVQDCPCSTCREVTLLPQKDARQKLSVTVYCAEPSTVHQHNLQVAQREMGLTSTIKLGNLSMTWRIKEVAFSNKVGTANFTAGCNTELCSLGGSGTLVNTTTIDEFAYDNYITFFDVLKIDTEGYDAAVIEGSLNMLTHHRVGLLFFEYNVMGLWENTTLLGVVTHLQHLGYTCYLEGKPLLTRLTGCWAPEFEFKVWSNVICHVRGHRLQKKFHDHSYMQQLNYHGPSMEQHRTPAAAPGRRSWLRRLMEG